MAGQSSYVGIHNAGGGQCMEAGAGGGHLNGISVGHGGAGGKLGQSAMALTHMGGGRHQRGGGNGAHCTIFVGHSGNIHGDGVHPSTAGMTANRIANIIFLK